MQVIEHAFDWLDAPPVRVHGLDVPLPYAANLERLALPQPEWVIDAVKEDRLMATNILMPALSPTMTEGTLARWLKKEGEKVKSGDVLAEIETDKATMEVEAVDEGVLGKILVGDGTQGVKVNPPIAVLVEPGETVPDFGATGRSPAPPTPAPVVQEAAAAPKPVAAQRGNGHDAQAASGQGRIFASPLARRMAEQAGIALGGLKGSGPNGRIVKADIEAALQKGRPPRVRRRLRRCSAGSGAPAPAPQITAPHQLLPNSTMRKVFARRLTESKQTIPHFYISMDIEIDALLSCCQD